MGSYQWDHRQVHYVGHDARFLPTEKLVINRQLGTTTRTSSDPVPVIGKDSKLSRGHAYPRGLGKGDIGGNFHVIHHEFESNTSGPYYVGQRASKPECEYRGPLYLTGNLTKVPGLHHPPVHGLSSLELNALGSRAISRTIPTNPIFDAATFLGELREGLPHMIGANLIKGGKRPHKAAADEYLNYQFGIAPIISDAENLVTAVRESERILAQLARDSGKNVRRRYRFPRFEERTEVVSSAFESAQFPRPAASSTQSASAFLNTTTRRLTKTTVKWSDVWFSGCYTYLLNPGSSTMGRLEAYVQRAEKLYGVRLGADTLWELSPWSWLVDWKFNVGDVIHNLTAFSSDNLVLRWGYLMETAVHEVTYTLEGATASFSSPPLPGVLYETYRTVSKKRIRASPYGFGILPGSFSTKQLAILAALGISNRGR